MKTIPTARALSRSAITQVSALGLIALLAASATPAAAGTPTSCESLTNFSYPDTTINSAQSQAGGAYVAPDAATAVVVLTHDDKFDLPLVRGALATDAFYVGWLGSRRNQERRRGLLVEAGVAEDELDRISGPSGLDVGAESPAETAVSILAEILAVRAGRSGGRLRDAKSRIHGERVGADKK